MDRELAGIDAAEELTLVNARRRNGSTGSVEPHRSVEIARWDALRLQLCCICSHFAYFISDMYDVSFFLSFSSNCATQVLGLAEDLGLTFESFVEVRAHDDLLFSLYRMTEYFSDLLKN